MAIGLMKTAFYKDAEVRNELSRFVLNSEVLSMGKEVQAFEKAFASWQGRKFAVMLNSGSSANLVLIQALLNLGVLKRGFKVGVSALTWATNIMPLLQLGLEPVAIDCSLTTLNVDLANLKTIKNLDCLFITNALGFCDDLPAIRAYCEKNHILLLEDNCESLGSAMGGVKLGNFGLASTFSFFVGHHLSTIEGGMVCVDDEEIYEQLLMVRSHGWDRQLSSERQAVLREAYCIDNFYAKYTFYDLAYNLRPTDIQGFLGNIQMAIIDEIVMKRENNFNRIKKVMDGNINLLELKLEHMSTISNFNIPLIAKTKSGFEAFKYFFEKSHVEIRPIISGDITKQPFFKKYVGEFDNLINANLIHDHGFYFVNRPDLTEDEMGILMSLVC